MFCGGPSGTCEHIVPRSECPEIFPDTGFSRDHWTNLAPSCFSCNRNRGTKGIMVYLVELNEEAERSKGTGSSSTE